MPRIRVVVLVLALVAAPARAQVCTGVGPEITDYGALQPGVRGWVDVRWDGRVWMPVRPLDMPMHHASRLEWIDAADHPELDTMRDRTLRISFVVVERRLERSSHAGVLIEATYRVDVGSICARPT